jgi:hypothetical protein
MIWSAVVADDPGEPPRLPSQTLGLGAPRHLCSPLFSALSPRADAPLLHDEAFALFVAQIELFRRDGFGRFSVGTLNDSEEFASLAADATRQIRSGRPEALVCVGSSWGAFGRGVRDMQKTMVTQSSRLA